MVRWQKEREQVIAICHQLVAKNLVVAKAGNVSLYLPPDRLFIITPTSQYYDALTPGDIPVIDLNGEVVDGFLAPSSEWRLHLAVYQARPDVRAVIHTHSLYASAVAVSGRELPPFLEEAVLLLGGAVQVAPYAPTGTAALAANTVAALGNRRAVLLANHGAVGVGADLREALDACEVLEKTAGVYLQALAAGNVNLLPPEGISSALDFFLRRPD